MSDEFIGEEPKPPAMEGGVCSAHGPFARDIQWVLLSVRNVLKLAWVSTGVLVGIFGAVLKFGMDMTGSSQKMQAELVSLRSDVSKLEATDVRVCAELEKLKDKHRGKSPWERNAGAAQKDGGGDDVSD